MTHEIGRAVAATIEALRRVSEPRHFESTERGYQGWFVGAVQSTYAEVGLLRRGRIVEMEYQKRPAVHGTSQRPDIVVHVPRQVDDPSAAKKGNFAVYALKKNASLSGIADDLAKLEEMICVLDYRVGFFVNVGAERPGMHAVGRPADTRIHSFAVRRGDCGVVVNHEWFHGPQRLPRVESIEPGEHSMVWPRFGVLTVRGARLRAPPVGARSGGRADVEGERNSGHRQKNAGDHQQDHRDCHD